MRKIVGEGVIMPHKLFVGGLSFNTSSDRLREVFAAAGAVVSATVVTDRDTGRSRGFGFVEFALVGIPLLLGTIGLVAVLGDRLLPVRTPRTISVDLSEHARTLARQYELPSGADGVGGASDRDRARRVAVAAHPARLQRAGRVELDDRAGGDRQCGERRAPAAGCQDHRAADVAAAPLAADRAGSRGRSRLIAAALRAAAHASHIEAPTADYTIAPPQLEPAPAVQPKQ